MLLPESHVECTFRTLSIRIGEQGTMSKKIATADASAMNSLYKGELSRLGFKVAQKGGGKEEVAGISHDAQAFADHSEYMSILESVMKEDEKTAGDPNDPVID